MSPQIKLVRASCVVPMDGVPIVDGAVAFQEGTIVAVGIAQQLAAQYPDAQELDRRGFAVFPGLINAHTHLELSVLSQGPAPDNFVGWIERLLAGTPTSDEALRQSVMRAVPIGVEQCLRFGVTCVGDISRRCGITRALLRQGPLRVVSYGEIQAMAQRRALLEERIATATDQKDASQNLQVGLSPHAPYSVEIDGYARCLEVAREHTLPLATHLAETPDEAAFLSNHAGPFRDLWNHLQAWDEKVPRFTGGPIRMAAAIGMVDYPTLLAHVNYCDDEELEVLAGGQASVVYCPRTHAYFGHPPHRWRDMLRMGINVAIGTDSCASSPDLNLVEELRLLHRLAPQTPALDLWRLATANGARAVGNRNIGILRPGYAADFVLFPANSDDPLTEILERRVLPAEVWIDGKIIRPSKSENI